MAENKDYKILEMMKDGKILESYGQKYLVTVTMCTGIGKVRWSIVELNTKGANHNDFYLDMWQMRQLCEEIRNGKANVKFAADKEKKYPEAYQYVTGEMGAKRLAIGGGQKGIRVSISIKEGESNDFKFTVAPYQEVLEMAFLFQLVTGLIPVTEYSYYHELYLMYKANETNRNKEFRKAALNKKEETTAPAEPPKVKAKEEPVAAEDFKITGEEKTPEPEAKPEKSETPNPTTESAIKDFRMKVTIPLTDMEGGKKALKGITEDNQTLAVVFGTNLTKNVQIWKTFETKGKKAGSIIRIKGILLKDRIIADEIVC